MSHSKKWTELAKQTSLDSIEESAPNPTWKLNRLRNSSVALLEEAEQVLKDFQASQLLLQSKAYLRLQQLIEYINEGD